MLHQKQRVGDIIDFGEKEHFLINYFQKNIRQYPDRHSYPKVQSH